MSQESLLGAVGVEADKRYAAITDSLERIEAGIEAPPIPPDPEPPTPEVAAWASGVYTGANKNTGQAETDFGNWRGREVEKVLTFTPDDTWDHTWWMSVFGGSFPYRDRLCITRGLCLKNETVDSPFPTGKFKAWAQAAKDAGITKPIWRLGHEANGNWYPWKIQGHEQTWHVRFEKAAAEIRQVDANATIGMCLAAGQKTSGFTMPDGAYVDEYGVDWYDVTDSATTIPTHAGFADSYDVPFSIPEWGCWANDGSGGHGDNPAYIQNVHDKMTQYATPGSWEAYFNKDSSSLHVLDHYPNSKAKYKDLFGDAPAASMMAYSRRRHHGLLLLSRDIPDFFPDDADR